MTDSSLGAMIVKIQIVPKNVRSFELAILRVTHEVAFGREARATSGPNEEPNILIRRVKRVVLVF
jgi:hypothetical protein